MKTAHPVALAIAEALRLAETLAESVGTLDGKTVTVVRSTIASAQKTLTEGYDDDAADTELTELLTVVFGDVDPSGPFWSVQLAVAEKVLSGLSYDARAELIHRTSWSEGLKPFPGTSTTGTA